MKRLVLALCVMVAGCANGQSRIGGSDAVNAVPGIELPAPDRTDLVGGGRPYLIGPFDKLTINVFGVEELTAQEVQVDASGRVSFPLAGVIEAGGQTPNEVASIIRERLRGQYIRNPQVTVNLRETVSQVITVDGQVREPGLYPVIGRMTLMRAVATAKGAGEFAKLEDVVVFRTVRGQKYAALYNLKAIRRGGYADPEVFANDVVVVGDSPARRLFRDLVSVAPLLTAPLIIALQN
ncbi:polysaccharide biosynthesis/export family protein [uncultured Sphingomonas sp.]|uniref:polysaccharide biosynthesis/export family protein n=1 Tax=uncultured Sphingomonas sp. TaxID=158754 RepID=UPI0035CAFBA4